MVASDTPSCFGGGKRHSATFDLVYVDVKDRGAAVQSGSKRAMADPRRNRFVSDDDVDHSSDAGWLTVVNVKFHLGPAVSAAEMIKIA